MHVGASPSLREVTTLGSRIARLPGKVSQMPLVKCCELLILATLLEKSRPG